MTARSAGGASAATCNELKPPHEIPIMPTRPLHHGCSASQAISSTASFNSAAEYSSPNNPSESPLPRMSTRIAANSVTRKVAMAGGVLDRGAVAFSIRQVLEDDRHRRAIGVVRQPQTRSDSSAVAQVNVEMRNLANRARELSDDLHAHRLPISVTVTRTVLPIHLGSAQSPRPNWNARRSRSASPCNSSRPPVVLQREAKDHRQRHRTDRQLAARLVSIVHLRELLRGEARARKLLRFEPAGAAQNAVSFFVGRGYRCGVDLHVGAAARELSGIEPNVCLERLEAAVERCFRLLGGEGKCGSRHSRSSNDSAPPRRTWRRRVR